MVKLVSLSNKAYDTLLKMKRGKESFSDVVLRVVEKKKEKSIVHLAGRWKDDKKIDTIFEKILKEQHKTMYTEKGTSW